MDTLCLTAAPTLHLSLVQGKHYFKTRKQAHAHGTRLSSPQAVHLVLFGGPRLNLAVLGGNNARAAITSASFLFLVVNDFARRSIGRLSARLPILRSRYFFLEPCSYARSERWPHVFRMPCLHVDRCHALRNFFLLSFCFFNAEIPLFFFLFFYPEPNFSFFIFIIYLFICLSAY